MDTGKNMHLALLFAAAQLKADELTFQHLLESKYVDNNAIAFALQAIDVTRRVVMDAIKGKAAIA